MSNKGVEHGLEVLKLDKESQKLWLGSLLVWLLSALLGLVLRSMPFGYFNGLSFEFIRHAHSHLAMMGWLFTALATALVHLFYKGPWRLGVLRILKVNLLLSPIMGAAFALQGYGLVSIILSTLHVFLTYLFSYYFLKSPYDQSDLAHRWARIAIFFLVLSSAGLWTLPLARLSFGADHLAVQVCVKFFLHFQLHGWFTWGGLAILGKIYRMPLTPSSFFNTKVFIFTTAFSASWIAIPLSINIAWILQIVLPLQVLSAIVIYQTFQPLLQVSHVLFKRLSYFVLWSFLSKYILTLVLIHPDLIQSILGNHFLTIGAIHLSLLGFTSLAVLLWAQVAELKQSAHYLQIMFWLILAFLIMEAILFTQGSGFLLSGKGFEFANKILWVTALAISVLIATLVWIRLTIFQTIYVLLPLAFTSVGLGIYTGLTRLGAPLPHLEITGFHGPIMVGGFLGGLISLERCITRSNRFWMAVPILALTSIPLFILNLPNQAYLAQLLASIGLLSLHLRQMAENKAGDLWPGTIGTLLWVVASLRLLLSPLIEMSVLGWEGFILFTVLGERMELSRFLNISQGQRTVRDSLLAALALSFIIPFHTVGLYLQSGLTLLVIVAFLKSEMAWKALKKGGQFSYIATAILSGYLWLGIHAFWASLGIDHPLYYDIYLHTFFLGFGFSMIWAHAPIIVPALLRRQLKLYHPSFWVLLGLFHLSLMARVVSSALLELEARWIFSSVNGVMIVLFFITLASRVIKQSRISAQ